LVAGSKAGENEQVAATGRAELRVLGSLEVIGESGPVALSALKQRQLLAVLAVHAGTARSSDYLIDALWSADKPQSPGKTVQVYVSQLRRLLPAGIVISTRESGYALELEDDALDAARFERLVAEGRAASHAGNPALAASLLQRALALWRGQAYGDFAYADFARAEAERLEDLRLAAIEERIEAELELGQHVELLPELRSLAASHPLRERLLAQEMLALYRAGQQAEALAVYAEARTKLVEELGLEPGTELRDLQRRILQQDPALAAPRAGDDRAASIPRSATPLLGRERELAEIAALL
jgi:DNA-binding SARP family transcriptional activator